MLQWLQWPQLLQRLLYLRWFVYLVLRFYPHLLVLTLKMPLQLFLKPLGLLGSLVQESQPLRLLVQELARQ